MYTHFYPIMMEYQGYFLMQKKVHLHGIVLFIILNTSAQLARKLDSRSFIYVNNLSTTSSILYEYNRYCYPLSNSCIFVLTSYVWLNLWINNKIIYFIYLRMIIHAVIKRASVMSCHRTLPRHVLLLHLFPRLWEMNSEIIESNATLVCVHFVVYAYIICIFLLYIYV